MLSQNFPGVYEYGFSTNIRKVFSEDHHQPSCLIFYQLMFPPTALHPPLFLPFSDSELLAFGRTKNRGMVIWEFEVKFLNCNHGFMGCYPKTYYLYGFPWC